MDPKPPSPDQQSDLPPDGQSTGGSAHWTVELGALSGVGMTLGIATTLGLFAGQWADRKWGVTPYFTVTGAFLGFAAGIANLVRVYEFFSARFDRRPRPGGGSAGERPPDS